MSVEPSTQPAAAAGTVNLGDLDVNRMGLGAMRLTGPSVIGEPADPENSLAVLRRAIELGVDFIDTADSYGPEINERQVAEALHPYQDHLVIATKGGLLTSGRENGSATAALRRSARPARRASAGSLDRIDLYQLHSVDPSIPIEESAAPSSTCARGKIRHIGLSNVDARQLARAREVATIVSGRTATTSSTGTRKA